jgi:hypothetical protein
MKIYCISCNLYLGEIRDGSLRIGTYYICNKCKEKWRIANQMAENARKETPDFINDLFKGFKL